MKYLALDIGGRRTGVAYADTDIGIPMPLATLHHKSPQEFLAQVLALTTQRGIEHIIVGLPRLPSGEEGSQAEEVRKYAFFLLEKGLKVTFIDERYTTPRSTQSGSERRKSTDKQDVDAVAACEILRMHMKY